MQEGGSLASTDTSYDQAFLVGVVLNGMDTWIGLRRKVVYLILNELKTNSTKHLSRYNLNHVACIIINNKQHGAVNKINRCHIVVGEWFLHVDGWLASSLYAVGTRRAL